MVSPSACEDLHEGFNTRCYTLLQIPLALSYGPEEQSHSQAPYFVWGLGMSLPEEFIKAEFPYCVSCSTSDLH